MTQFKYIIFCLTCLLITACASIEKKSSNSDRTQNIETVKQGSPEQVNLNLGVGYLKRGKTGDLDIALEKFKKSIGFNPQYALAHSMIANVYDQKGLFDNATHHYQLSIKYNNKNPDIFNNYANFLCQRGQYDEAISYYLKIVNNPQYELSSYAYENAGICAYKAKNFEQAETYFRKSIGLDANQSNSLYYLMLISKDHKQYMKARAFLQRLEGLVQSSAEVLAAGYEIEQALGNHSQSKKYLTQLQKQYPDYIIQNKIE